MGDKHFRSGTRFCLCVCVCVCVLCVESGGHEVWFWMTAASAEKVRKYRNDWKINKDSVDFFNGSSDKETRSMILFCDGSICTSSVSAKVLNERAIKLAEQIKVVVVKSED